MAIERRCVFGPDAEVRAKKDAAGKVTGLEGYAARYESLSVNLGGFVEKIARGAFTRAIKDKADVRGLFNHNPDHVLGRVSSGTLRLEARDVGLWMDVDLPDTTTARDVAALVGRGDITGQSFGFRTVRDQWDLAQPVPVRTLLDVDIFDVGPVTFPAYERTSVGARSVVDGAEEAIQSLEAAMRSAGMSARARRERMLAIAQAGES